MTRERESKREGKAKHDKKILGERVREKEQEQEKKRNLISEERALGRKQY